MLDPRLDPNPITLNPLYSMFFGALRENPSLYPDFIQVRALSSKAHATIAKWEGVVDTGFFTDEHELSGEEIADLLVHNSDRGLLEDYKQFQADGETVRSIWAKHKDIVDMRFWTVEAVPVVYEIAASLGLDSYSDIPS